MGECIAEDDLLELARGGRPLGDTPALEAHLADCPVCSALLASLLAASHEDEGERRDLVGRTLGPYRLDALIGAGAMGEVYRGWDLRLQRHVAVKALSARFAESPERVRRLEAEGRAAASISHPNVVRVYDVGSDGGVPFIVSELIAGESLRSVIGRRALSPRTALELGMQLVRGLAAAHGQGVVHRDLKPENLIVAEDGTLKILDFGLAKQSGEPQLDATEPGTLLGTSGYLSPEQARGEPADARSDIFAVGAILHEMLTGERAFAGATFAERLSAVLRDDPPLLDGEVGPVVARCLDKDPKRRFQTANDLAWVLEGLPRPAGAAAPARARRPSVSRRTFLLGAGATAVGGALFGRLLAPGRRASLPVYQQLTYRQGRVASARFTRDGGSVIHSAAWDELPLSLYTFRLGGGGMRALEYPSADLLAVSSREVALSVGHRYVEGFHQRGQLAVAPLEGGEPRMLGLEVQQVDYTPDGAELAIVRRSGPRFTLELPAGRVLLEGAWLSYPRVSPDGALVACLIHDSPYDDRGDVVVVDRAGGKPRPVSEGWSSVAGLAWDPGGRDLWLTASRAGANNAIRRMTLDGREDFVAQTTGRLRLHDVAPDGRVAVSHDSWRMRMMARAPGASADTDLSLSDVSMAKDISADGTTLVFAEFGDVDSASGCFLRPTKGGPALRLGEGMPVDLADDGRGVLALVYGDPARLVAYPVPAGASRPIPLPGLSSVMWARWAAGSRILVGGAAAGRPPRIWRGEGSALAPITDEGVFGFGAMSPDGRRIAFISDDALLTVDIDAPGPPRAVPGKYPDERMCAWRTGGTEVYVRTTSPPIQIRRVDVTTGASAAQGEISPPRLGQKGVDSVVLSASGEAYAYSYGQELSRLYAMTLEAGES